MADRVYVDTSAYLAILLGESKAEDVERRAGRAQLVSSSLLVLEVKRTLVRLSRERRLSPEKHQEASERFQADLDGFFLRDLTLELCRSNIFPTVQVPRSLDLVHLRTALSLHAEEPLEAFLTLDHSQRLAARELGLPA